MGLQITTEAMLRSTFFRNEAGVEPRSGLRRFRPPSRFQRISCGSATTIAIILPDNTGMK